MADSNHLDVLEKRISALETIVFGNADKDALYPKDRSPRIQVIESLLALQAKIVAATAGKKKIAQVYQNIPDLKRYMDFAYTDELTLSDDAKEELILSEDDFLHRRASLLHTVQEYSEAALSSEHIKNVPRLAGKLQELSKIHIQQQDKTAEVTEEAAKLIDNYNSTITSLSKMFLLWDEELTKLEMQSQVKKSAS